MLTVLSTLPVILRVQLLKGSFIQPFMFILIGLVTRETSITFLLGASLFCFYHKREDFNFTAVYITGVPLNKYLKIYNISWLFWFNILIGLQSVFLFKQIFLETSNFISFIIEFNILFMLSTIIGNTIGNSIIISFGNFPIQQIISIIFLAIGITLTKGIIYFYTFIFEINVFEVKIALLLVVFLIWYVSLIKTRYFRYIKSRVI